MNYSFKNVPNQNPERVGYGPQVVGGSYGPQVVGQGAIRQQRQVTHGRQPASQMRGQQGQGYSPTRGGSHTVTQQHVHHPLPGGGYLVEKPPTSKQVVFLGFGPQTLNGNATFVFEGKPQRIFRGERLTVPSAIANNFAINDLKVGTDSMNVGTGPIPASVFSELGMLVALEIETASPGISILFSISNLAGGPQSFFSGLLGTSVT